MAISKEDLESAVGELKELINKRADGLEKEIKSIHTDLINHDERAETMTGELQEALALERRITRLEQKAGFYVTRKPRLRAGFFFCSAGSPFPPPSARPAPPPAL